MSGEKLRNSGIDIIGDVPWGTHFCQLYQTKEDLTDTLVPYFKAGLENNELCVWVIPQLLEEEEAKEVLKKAVPDIDAYLEKGQIEIISYTHGRVSEVVLHPQKSLNHLIEKTNQALASGYDGLRFTGSAIWLRSADWHHLICYEERLDSVIGNHHLIVLCIYLFDRCDATGIIDIAFNHQFVLAKKEGKWERIENSGRKRAEEAETKLKRTLENLEEKVKERTTELEEAYKTLVENERRLYEAQKMAHIGSWDWDIIKDKMYWSDETYSIFGFTPRESGSSYDVILSRTHTDDREYVDNAVKRSFKGEPFDIGHRIVLADGTERVVHAQGEVIFNEESAPVRMRGTVQDITSRIKAIKALEEIDQIRIKEIHHRIKNNLQVISSLLDLQAEKFSDLEVCKTPEVIEAFIESQNRIASMALIHEELYKGEDTDTLDFANYLQKLTADLFSSYNLGSGEIKLKLDLEQIYLDMDTAIPLGIIVNELVSNALRHAFPAGGEGKIHISLHKIETFAVNYDFSGSHSYCMEKNNSQYMLTIADNGKGIPKEMDLDDADTLGLQLVKILVEQIDGCIELKRDHGTEFTIWFRSVNE